MHTPEKWQMGSAEKIQKFMQEFGFATLVSNSSTSSKLISGSLEASHLPLLLMPDEGEHGVLYGHFARANAHYKAVDNEQVLAIFSGPHAYISPTWYESYPAVPTWNYSAVHASGVLELTDDDTTASILTATINKYEPSLLADGGFIPDEFKAKLSKGIIGFKITIKQLQAIEKLGQHRATSDQQGVSAALSSSDNLEAKLLFNYMSRHNVGLGDN